MYTECPLYGIQSKKQLFKFLSINDENLRKGICSEFQQVEISHDGRLLEKSFGELKEIQKRINGCLKKCEYPDYLHSGIKGRSYYTNAKVHQNCRYMFKLDISAFFPNTKREKVFDFFLNELSVSPDVAKLLTDYTTIDLSAFLLQNSDLQRYLDLKRVRHTNHLITGAPTSILLSFLCNRNMFDELSYVAEKNDYKFSVYVDDIFYSSKVEIPPYIKKSIIAALCNNGYNVSESKIKYYKSTDYKIVTGVAISPDNNLRITNKLRYKIANAKSNGDNKLSTIGMIRSAQFIEPYTYNNVLSFLSEQNID